MILQINTLENIQMLPFITGSIEQTYAPLNKKIKILLKQNTLEKIAFKSFYLGLFFYSNLYTSENYQN